MLTAYADASKARHGWRQIKGKCDRLAEQLGHLLVADLRQSHIRGYIAARRAVPIKDGTIREELSKLRAAMRWGAAEGLCEERPIKIPLASSVRSRWLTREEADRLVAAAIEPHVRLFVLLALHTAGRSSAILELPWSAVDFERRVIDLGRKEGGKARAIVPMTRTLAAALSAARAIATTPWVVEYAGQRVRNGRTGWQLTRERAGLPDVWRHDLRRTAGSLLLQDGVSIELVAAFLGHKNIATTRRVYAHLAVEHLRDAANRLDRNSDDACDGIPTIPRAS